MTCRQPPHGEMSWSFRSLQTPGERMSRWHFRNKMYSDWQTQSARWLETSFGNTGVMVVQGQDGCWCLEGHFPRLWSVLLLPGNCNGLERSVAFWHCLCNSSPLSTDAQVVASVLHIATCRGHMHSQQLFKFTQLELLEGLCVNFSCGQTVAQVVVALSCLPPNQFWFRDTWQVTPCSVQQHGRDSWVFASLLTHAYCMTIDTSDAMTKGHGSSLKKLSYNWTSESLGPEHNSATALLTLEWFLFLFFETW